MYKFCLRRGGLEPVLYLFFGYFVSEMAFLFRQSFFFFVYLGLGIACRVALVGFIKIRFQVQPPP